MYVKRKGKRRHTALGVSKITNKQCTYAHDCETDTLLEARKRFNGKHSASIYIFGV